MFENDNQALKYVLRPCAHNHDFFIGNSVVIRINDLVSLAWDRIQY